jgi:hypothetical protein
MAKNCFYYFGVVLFIATLPISLPIFMYMERNKNEEPVQSQQTVPPAAAAPAPVQVMLPAPLQNNHHTHYNNNKRIPSLTPNEIAELAQTAPQVHV